MIALLDAPEFAAAKDALSTTLEHVEQARQGRLKFLQDALNRTEDELERVKQQALELPALIARYRAEIAKLEATTGADILRDAMGQPQTKTQTEAPLWGLDLRTVKFGSDIVIADAGLCDVAMSVALIKKGEHFRVEREAMAKADWPDQPRVKIEVVATGYQCFIAAIQPAHVVKHACPRCDEGMQALDRTALATGLEVAAPPPSEWCDGSGKR